MTMSKQLTKTTTHLTYSNNEAISMQESLFAQGAIKTSCDRDIDDNGRKVWTITATWKA